MKSEVQENNVDFSLIRYSQCWEDTEILLEALDIREEDICFGIASAGDNVFSMLTKNPEKVIAVDLSSTQLALVELKKEIIKNFEHGEMLLFLGVLEKDDVKRIRAEMYGEIRSQLSKKAREYWDYNREVIEQGVIHAGKFEKFFKIFRERILLLVHSKKRVEKFLEKKTSGERKEYYTRHWENFRWKLMFKLFFSNYVVGKLGRDREFFRYVEKDISKVMLAQSRYASTELSPYENPYVNYILTGGYRPDCLPYFLRKENFSAIKNNLDRLEIVEDSVEGYLEKTGVKIDKFNLSDIFEYMSEKNYERLMNRIYENANDGALLTYWNLVVERNSEIIEAGKGSRKFERLKAKDERLHRKDMTFFYTDLVVEKVVKRR